MSDDVKSYRRVVKYVRISDAIVYCAAIGAWAFIAWLILGTWISGATVTRLFLNNYGEILIDVIVSVGIFLILIGCFYWRIIKD
jgi:hypothetical protein